MENFTPFTALIGGFLIGAAATLMMALNGRVTGISGILGGLMQAPSSDTLWRVAFLSGIVSGPLVYGAIYGLPELYFPTPLPVMLLGGLLVGYGTRLGSGCTSGHGICGVSRLSLRSILATITFVALGIVTVGVLRATGVF